MSAILSLEVFQERQCQERFRSRAHAALDRFQDRLETPMSEPGSCAPTLMEITEAVSQERCGFTAALVEAFIERRHGPFLAQEEAACPKCERLLQAKAVAFAHGGNAAGCGDLGAALFLLRGLSPRVLSAGRSPGSVGAVQAVGRAAGRGQAGAGDAPRA